MTMIPMYEFRSFNSRSREGSDAIHPQPGCHDTRFNSRSREGSDIVQPPE